MLFSKATKHLSPERHGVMDNALACYAGGPGLIPAMSKWFFSLGHNVLGKNGASHDIWHDLASPCSFKYNNNPSHAPQAAKLRVSATNGS